MERLDAILQAIVAQGDDTNNKVLGAAFVVTNKEGKPVPLAQNFKICLFETCLQL